MTVPTGAQYYETIRDLASGAFGRVTLCKDLRNDKEVAIKHIDRGRRIDDHVLAELLNHRRLLHHHIVHFKEVFLTEEHLCIVMEYASGGNLADFVKKKNGLEESEARWYFQQLIVGLDYCHRLDIANRDIKLENTLLSGDSAPLLKICDFGYSKKCDESQPKTRVGSPAYIAPEVILNQTGQNYDGKKADIWCCGVFLYALVYVSRPFDREEDKECNKNERVCKLLRRIINDPVVIPASPAMSFDFYDLLKKILVKNPKERITMEGIMHHRWFQEDLPPGAIDMNKYPQINEGCPQTEHDVLGIFEEAKSMRMRSIGTLMDDIC